MTIMRYNSEEHYEPSTQSEWDCADAYQRGEENPDAPWVLTDRDVWHRNPYYTGPEVPHPEFDEDAVASNGGEWAWVNELLPDLELLHGEVDDGCQHGEVRQYDDDDLPF